MLSTITELHRLRSTFLHRGTTSFIFLALLYPMLFFAQNEENQDRDMIDMMNKINPHPKTISFESSLPVNNEGGHIQGIQYYAYENHDYYFLSGSSDTYSYYSIVSTENENKVISVNKILNNPYRHSGGFQISNNLMAIGVEDNYIKDKSKVYIYKIDDPRNPPTEPLKIIRRKGIAKRVTAGCVGIISLKDHILVVVGNWDTKHLDIYRIPKDKLHDPKEEFELISTIELAQTDRSQWSDKDWLSYQNINLILGRSGTLYLAGMATKEGVGNFLDMYRLDSKNTTDYELRKIHTRRFPENSYSRFQWGAGITINKERQLQVFSTEAHFTPHSRLLRFE